MNARITPPSPFILAATPTGGDWEVRDGATGSAVRRYPDRRGAELACDALNRFAIWQECRNGQNLLWIIYLLALANLAVFVGCFAL